MNRGDYTRKSAIIQAVLDGELAYGYHVNMIVLIHIVIALTSMLVGAALLARPVQALFRTQYVLIAATLGSGTYLVVATGSPLLHTCATGLFYLAIVTAGLVLARRKVRA